MFEDDTTVTHARERIDSLACEDITKLTMWFESNKLPINVAKCEANHIVRGRPETMVIKDQILFYKSTCKNL